MRRGLITSTASCRPAPIAALSVASAGAPLPGRPCALAGVDGRCRPPPASGFGDGLALAGQGGATWGNTQQEALKNIQEVVQMVVESLMEHGEAWAKLAE